LKRPSKADLIEPLPKRRN